MYLVTLSHPNEGSGDGFKAPGTLSRKEIEEAILEAVGKVNEARSQDARPFEIGRMVTFQETHASSEALSFSHLCDGYACSSGYNHPHANQR